MLKSLDKLQVSNTVVNSSRSFSCHWHDDVRWRWVITTIPECFNSILYLLAQGYWQSILGNCTQPTPSCRLPVAWYLILTVIAVLSHKSCKLIWHIHFPPSFQGSYGNNTQDYAIEGNVANALRALQDNCTSTFYQMVNVLKQNKMTIHSFQSFNEQHGVLYNCTLSS